jgi:hypothetical protein
MKKKKLYRTVVQFEVLSEEPIPEGLDFEEIMGECADGEYSGKSTVIVENKPIVGKRAVNMVVNQGSDPEFFRMDSRGYEISDEDEEDL